jgi:enoyl-CoA hydratase/carnithine racemase
MSEILFEVDQGVATLTFNRPERLNAWTPAMFREFPRLLQRCSDDDAVRAVVVTGAGRGFCSGFDPTAGVAPDTRAVELPAWRTRKPVIAAINGAAVGMGLTLTLHFDVRIAAADAKLGFVFVRRGLLPEANSLWLLPRLIGLGRATELLLTGRSFDGAEARALGLVHEALPAAEVLPRARAIAAEIAAQTAPVAVALTKRLLWEHLWIDDPQAAYQREHAWSRFLGSSDDAREGIAAFLEKRPARWRGRPSAELPEGDPP